MMTSPKIIEEGRLTIGRTDLPVFLLDDGRKAVSIPALYHFLTGKNVKKNVRTTLAATRFHRYLPKAMLNAPDVLVKTDLGELSIFDTKELVALCRAVTQAGMQDQLSATWRPALNKVQRLLMAFAAEGADKVIAKAVAQNPLITVKDFDRLMGQILDHQPAKPLA
jgi:hypothetical protein